MAAFIARKKKEDQSYLMFNFFFFYFYGDNFLDLPMCEELHWGKKKCFKGKQIIEASTIINWKFRSAEYFSWKNFLPVGILFFSYFFLWNSQWEKALQSEKHWNENFYM